MKKLRVIFLGFLLGCFWVEQATAETVAQKQREKIQTTDKTADFLRNVHPQLEISETFNDNIFEVKRDTVSDIITEIKPGLSYKRDPFRRKRMFIYGEAGSLIRKYARYDEYDTENPYVTFSLNYGSKNRNLGLDYKIRRGQETLANLATTAERDLLNYWTKDYKINFYQDLNRLNFQTQYWRHVDSSEEEEWKGSQNYIEDELKITGSLRAFAKTYFFLEYAHDWLEYPKAGEIDREGNNYFLGIRGKISSKIRGLIKFGYQQNEFDDADNKTSNTVGIDLNYLVTRRLNIIFKATREIGDSALSGEELDNTQNFTLECNYLPPFNKKLILRTKLSYDLEQYESEREDSTYSFSLLSEYRLKKDLKLVGGYEFKRVTTQEELNEYNNNIASLKLISEF